MKVIVDEKKIVFEAEYDEKLLMTELNNEEIHIISVEAK